MKQEKSIPTIVGIIVLLLSLVAGVLLSSKKNYLGSKASGSCRPVNPQTTNITNSSFDVSFTTSSPCLSSIIVNGQTIPSPSLSKIHYFSVNYLKEDTPYSFNLIIDGVNYDKENYKVKTAKKPTATIPISNLAWGRVLNPNLSPASNAIVYLNIEGASPLSSPVTSSGNWNISLAISFNGVKDNWFVPPENQAEDIIVISEDGQATQIASNTNRNNPVPDIILGQNRFNEGNQENGQTGNIPTITPIISSQGLLLKNPAIDGEQLFTQQPEFFGQGPANEKIIIKVESPESFNGESVTKDDGTWSWSPPSSLTPGEHTITVSAKNPQTGIWETISRKFTVLASSNNLSFTASQSAQLTPTTTLAPTPTLIPTSTLVPTPTPSPIIRTVKPATSSGVPTSGTFAPTLLLIIFSIVLISSSLFLTKKDVD